MATSGVNMLMQLLQQSQDARQKAAYFDAQQQEAEAQRVAAQQQQNQSLAQQLRGQMLMHAMDDTARQHTDTVNYNRQVAADAAHWARVKEQENQRNARDDARWDAYLKAAGLKADAQRDSADIAGKSRVEAAKVPRVSRHYGYSITERRGDVGRGDGGGQEPDVRKQAEYNRMMAARAALGDAMKLAGSMPTTDNKAKVAEAQKVFDEAYAIYNRRYPERGAVAPATAPVVNNLPSMYLREQQAPAEDDLFTVK